MTDFVPHDFPCSAHLAVDGLVYFPRMLDKIRLQAAGRLGPEYHPFLGEGFDGRLCRFLGVSYAFVRELVLAGGADREILIRCLATGQARTAEEVQAWSQEAAAFGRAEAAAGSYQRLEENKAAQGLAHRADILTFFDFYEVDEKRRP